MKKLLTLFTLIFSLVAYGAVPLGTVPYAQLDTNDFGVTVAGHINTRLGVHTPSTPGDTWYLTINGTNINNGGTNFLQSINPTAGFLPVRGANTNFVDSLILQDATGLHVGTNFAGIIDYFGYPALTLGDTGGVNTYLTLYPDGLFLKDHYGNALNLYGQTANIGGLIYGKSIMQLGTMWGKVELADDNPAHTAKFQPTLPMGTSHTTLGSSTNAWEGLYAGSTKMFQFFDVIIDPGVSTNLNFAVDGVTYNIGAGGGSVGGTTINSLDTYLPVRLNAGAFDNSPLYTTGGFIATDGRIVFGPGDTNWIGRSGSSLIYSNNADASNPVQFTIERANGDYGSFGVSQAGGAFIRTAAGKAVQIGPNGDDPLYYFSSAAFYTTGGTLAGQQSLGTGTNNWAELRLGTNTLWGSYTDDGTQLLRNGIPLAGATVTYAAVTNALLATGSASDVLHGDGSWGAGGGGGDTNWVMISGNALHANTNASDILIDGTTSERTFNIQSLDSDFVGTVTLDALSNTPTGPGASGIFVQGGDSGGIVDSISIMSDPGLIWDQGTGIYFNETPILLLDNTGSVNLTNVSNGTFTGTLTVTNAAPLTTPALEVFGGMRIFRFETATNYTISITNHMVTATDAITLTLPSAASVGSGFQLILKAKYSIVGTVSVTLSGADTMDGTTPFPSMSPGDCRVMVSDGVSDWESLSFYGL